MFKNYCKIAWRNLVKGKAYSFINIVGLATGMGVALVIGLWIADEISYDTYYTNHNRLGQVLVKATVKDQTYTGSTVMMPLGKTLGSQYRDIFDKVSLTSFREDHILAAGDKKISRTGIWAQQDLPEMLSLQMQRGAVSVLKDPSTLMLSASVARALFGSEDPVNKTVRIDNKLEMKVGGVYEDLPHNTSFYDVKFLLPWDNKDNSYRNSNQSWEDHNGQLFVRMSGNTDAATASARIRSLPTTHIKGLVEEAMIFPLDRLHLYGEFKNGKLESGRIQFVRLFSIIGVFVLLLACINFMNLSTARSEKRAKEVGIRKTMGSLRGQLIGQFLSESILVVLLAFVLAILAVQLSMPLFNNLADKELVFPWSSLLFWVIALGFALFTGILSGCYPALYLSGFEPVKVLKGTFRVGRLASLPRQVLVVLQFSVSLTLIIGTIVVFRQIDYARDRPVGYTRAGLLTIGINTPDLEEHYTAIRTELLQKGLIENMAQSSQSTTGFNNNNGLEWRGKDPSDMRSFRNVDVTPDFGKTIGWTVVEGRDFSRDFATDSNGLILSEAAVKVIGIPHPIGEVMTFWGRKRTVIGVVKDLLTNSPYDPIEPAIFLGRGYMEVITIRVKAGQPMRTSLAGIGQVFRKYNPGSPFVYTFNDEDFGRKFAAEERIGSLATIFAIFAIFISCLGLFGLASFVAEQRRKEIGVRKVLGANVAILWGLLSKEFVKLVLISLLIAIPVAWFVMQRWLQGYTYRAPMSWWIFAVAAAGILLVTLMTVSYQALKAALMNPVRSLRSE